MVDLQQSPNWEKFKDVQEGVRIKELSNEGWPTGGPFGNADKVFTIITRSGQRHQARVDYSRQYASEGIKWRTLGGQIVDKFNVIAWREEEKEAR